MHPGTVGDIQENKLRSAAARLFPSLSQWSRSSPADCDGPAGLSRYAAGLLGASAQALTLPGFPGSAAEAVSGTCRLRMNYR